MLSGTCRSERGVCMGTSRGIIDEYGKDGAYLGRASEADVLRPAEEWREMEL